VCRSLSGFDFDSFFDECSKPSTPCEKVISFACKVKEHEKAASPQRNAFETHQHVPTPIPSQAFQPSQPSLTGLSEMKFDSDTFFDELLGGAGRHHGAASFKTSSVIW
jgi:hypothetical protein